MNRSAYEYYAQQILTPAVIEAWRACKLRQQSLSCWVSSRGGNQIEFHYNWNSSAIDLPMVREFNVIRGTSAPLALAQPGDKILIGEETKVIARNPDQDTLVNLNIVLSQRYAISCTGYVPHTPPPPHRSSTKSWAAGAGLIWILPTVTLMDKLRTGVDPVAVNFLSQTTNVPPNSSDQSRVTR